MKQHTMASSSRMTISTAVWPALLAVNLLASPCFAESRPNIVVVFVDNFGNGDLGCFGSTQHRTPHVDRLAREGMKLTSFYVSSGVCTPSRASMMTGCYPRRINMHVSGAGTAVLRPLDSRGLNPSEMTLAEVLKTAGYATGLFGKWHLGDQPEFLPTRQGFDEFFGIPYSDDMTKDKSPDLWPELPLMRGEQVIEAPPDRDFLVQRCTQELVSFIERHRDRPFFAYVPHTMPGSTSHPFSSPEFRGKSLNGEYGDAVEELDWSTGRILETLDRLGIAERTIVVWTSDNGAVRHNPPQGSNAPYRGYGYDTSEGAMRMPCVIRWPGKVPAGSVCEELCSTMDLLPTFARVAEASLPEQPIDGHDISELLFGKDAARSPWDEVGFGYYFMDQIQAVRSGPWKLYLPLEGKYINLSRKPADAASPARLYDVRRDLHEDHEVSADHPEIVARLTRLAEGIRADIGDMDRTGRGQRPAGHVETPRPLVPTRTTELSR